MPMSAGYIPFHPNPSKPKYKPPAGAVDAHCHVFGPEAKFPFAPARKYTPCDAPKETLRQRRDFLGFDKNVIVQATCHDTDNRALVDALITSNGKAKGVAFVGEEITDAGLKELDDAGVKGVRFNFIKRLVDSTPKDVMQRIATRIAKLGWHIVVYFEHADLDEMGPFLKSLPTTLVFDHMACPNVKEGVNGKHFQNWLKALDANKSWITKVTCPERFTLTGPPYDDVVPFARTIVERFPDRVIWGTDWPHPEHAEGGAGRRRPGRHDPEDRADRGAAEEAARRQSDEALLGLTWPITGSTGLQTSMPLAAAEKIVDGALKAGADAGLLPLTVAVLDVGGHIVLLKRQDGSGNLRADIAIGKAAGALGMGISRAAPSATG